MTATHAFTLAGGHPVLDFVNTVEDWTVPERLDHLQSFADAARFGEAAGVISHREALQLDPERASGARRVEPEASAERVSPTSCSSFDVCADSLERDPQSLARRASCGGGRRRDPPQQPRRGRARHRASWRRQKRRSRDGLPSSRTDPRRFGSESSKTRLHCCSSSAMPRVKACPTCGWFFLDVSKNQSRVWCSMDTCGARAKSRRYYRRTRRRRRNSQS